MSPKEGERNVDVQDQQDQQDDEGGQRHLHPGRKGRMPIAR
jgi:hypothetical protein